MVPRNSKQIPSVFVWLGDGEEEDSVTTRIDEQVQPWSEKSLNSWLAVDPR